MSAWYQYWISKLTQNSPDKLAEGLEKRWRNNAPSYVPCSLFSDSHGDAPWWSSDLERFLCFAGADDNILLTILESFEKTLDKVKPDLSTGFVWLSDILALRCLQTANKEYDDRRLNLLLTSIHKVVGSYPAADRAAYDYFYTIYTRITDALVLENYDHSALKVWRDFGLQDIPENAFSCFHSLEKNRMHRINPSFVTEGISPDFSEKASGYEERYAKLVVDLYNSLTDINALMMQGKNPELNRNLFLNFLNSPEHDRPSKWKDPYMNIQRILDYPWICLARMQVGENRSEAENVCRFILSLSKEDPVIHALKIKDFFVDELDSKALTGPATFTAQP